VVVQLNTPSEMPQPSATSLPVLPDGPTVDDGSHRAEQGEANVLSWSTALQPKQMLGQATTPLFGRISRVDEHNPGRWGD